MRIIRSLAAVVTCLALVAAILQPLPVRAAIGGKRAAVFMPFLNGGKTGEDSPGTHPKGTNSPYGFAWDLHGGADTGVYPLVASIDGAVNMKVTNVLPSDSGAGHLVEVEVKIGNTYVGKLQFNHLVGVQVSSGQNVTPSTRLGNTAPDNVYNDGCHGFPCSSGWLGVSSAAGIHTHVELMKGCYGPQGTNTNVGASTGIALLSENYSTANNSACDTNELNAVATALNVTAVTSQLTPDGIQHIYWATGDGRLRETWYHNGASGTSLMKDFDYKVTGLASEYTPADSKNHVYVATQGGTVHEVYFGPTGGYQEWPIASINNPITSLSFVRTTDGVAHVYWTTEDRRLMESWFGQGVQHTTVTRDNQVSNSTIRAVTAILGNDSKIHVYWGNDEGRLHDRWFSTTSSANGLLLMSDFNGGINALSTQYVPDGNLHVYSGTTEGKIYETWYGPSSNWQYNSWEAASTNSSVNALSSQYTPNDNRQHIFAATTDDKIHEVSYYPGVVNGATLVSHNYEVRALSSQYTPADQTLHVFWGDDAGIGHETWFRPNVLNNNQFPPLP